ncbi:MAG: hypothetical protein RLY66_508 [Candidatus Parcubacteria bacterium]
MVIRFKDECVGRWYNPAALFLLPIYLIWHIVLTIENEIWSRGGTGIRVRLRSVSRKGWGFDSPRDHYLEFIGDFW